MSKDNKKKEKSFNLKKVRNFFAHVLPLSIALVPVIWHSVLLGVFNFFQTDNNRVNNTGQIITSVLYLILIPILFVINFLVTKIIQKEIKNSEEILFNYSFLIEEIKDNIKAESELYNEKLFEQVSVLDRKKHIESIITSLQKFVCNDSNFSYQDVSVVLLYKKVCDRTRENVKKHNGRHTLAWLCGWEMIDEGHKSNMTADELIKNKMSTAYHLLEEEAGILFFHDKNGEPKRYLKYERDYTAYEVTKRHGSIFGYRFEIKNNNGELDTVAMLFISTFGERLCKSDKEVDIEKIKSNYKDEVFPVYINLLKKQLILLLENKQCEKSITKNKK